MIVHTWINSVLFNEVTNEWSEDYYLMDAHEEKTQFLKNESQTGSSKTRMTTVALLHRTQNDTDGKWEYYASGAERECRLVPTEEQSPINNANVGNASISFGKDQASFYLYDHLEEQTQFVKTETWLGRPKWRRNKRIN